MKTIVIFAALAAGSAQAQIFQPVPNILQQEQENIDTGRYGRTYDQQQQALGNYNQMQPQTGGIYNPYYAPPLAPGIRPKPPTNYQQPNPYIF